MPGDTSNTWVKQEAELTVRQGYQWKSEKQLLTYLKKLFPEINLQRQYVYTTEIYYFEKHMRCPSYVSLSTFVATGQSLLHSNGSGTSGAYIRELPMESTSRLASLENTVAMLANEVRASNDIMRQLLQVVADKEAK